MGLSRKSAADVLAESPIAGLLDHARLLDRITSAVARFGHDTDSTDLGPPPLRCALQGGTVVITVGSPSQAAKLRQQAVALHQMLQARVPELTGIRVRLQPGHLASPMTGPNPGASDQTRPPSPESIASALRFAEDLSETVPDSPLKRSAMRLRATLRARLESAK